MKLDYCEQEQQDGVVIAHVGLQFEDEPDSLYVARVEIGAEGAVRLWELYYNGFDCKYSFSEAEKAVLLAYMKEQGVACL
ncbi:hypothetical protein [Paenibacillus ferrarius]|uniref:hypothetical protein n=1 Tax=Paenibacillus ferrarius TaxID=1469647 RepID=UPI003D2CEC7F